MSGGSPAGSGGGVRQRHSQGNHSSDEDSEDDACSKPPRLLLIEQPSTWTRVLEDILWIGSAVFIVYFGDWRSNLIHVLLFDNRIKRAPLYLGLAGIFLNAGVVFYTGLSVRPSKKSNEKLEQLSFSAPLVALVGLLSFSLISFALWPIWSFLSIPLLITLLMASMVVWTHLPMRSLRPQAFALHADRILPL